MNRKSHNIDMTEGPLLGKVFAFTVPLFLTAALQLLYNAADVIVVGKFAGDTSLAAVGSTSALINLIVNLFMGMSVGAGVIVSQAIGAKNKERIEKTVHTSMLLSLFLGIGVGLLGFFISKQILVLMGTPEDVIYKATVYVKIYFLGLPAFMVYNFGASILRAAGDTKRPLYILTVAGMINVVFNIIFVVCFKLDVAGVAIATIISQYISAAVITVILIKDKEDYRLCPSKLKIDTKCLKFIVQYGVPMGIQSSMFSLSNVLIQSSINSFGTTVMAGNAAAANLEAFIYTAANSGAQAAISFTGQNFGAKKLGRIKNVIFCSMLCSAVLYLVVGSIVFIFKRPLLSFYTQSDAVITAGIKRFLIVSSIEILCGFMEIMANVVRGMGKSLVPMITTLFFVCVLRVVCIYTVFAKYHIIDVLYWSYPVTWVLALISHTIYFLYVYKQAKNNLKLNL